MDTVAAPPCNPESLDSAGHDTFPGALEEGPWETTVYLLCRDCRCWWERTLDYGYAGFGA